MYLDQYFTDRGIVWSTMGSVIRDLDLSLQFSIPKCCNFRMVIAS
jgi:hypothetical protein